METTINPAEGRLIELLTAAGLAASVIFDGDAEACPHCRPLEMKTAA